MEDPISPKIEEGQNSDIGMQSPKDEEEIMEPPLALSGRTGTEGQNEVLSGNDETVEDDQYDDYDRSDNNEPLTPLSHQLEESAEHK